MLSPYTGSTAILAKEFIDVAIKSEGGAGFYYHNKIYDYKDIQFYINSRGYLHFLATKNGRTKNILLSNTGFLK